MLLLLTPEKIFARLAPGLILFATLLFFLQSLARFRGRFTTPHGAGRETAAAGGPAAAGRTLAVAWGAALVLLAILSLLQGVELVNGTAISVLMFLALVKLFRLTDVAPFTRARPRAAGR